MRIYEHEAKLFLARAGIAVPASFGVLARADLPDGLEAVRYPAVVKAQVLVGGRGKAGGVRRVLDAGQARQAVSDILDLTIKGCRVESVLIEEAVDASGACYLGVSVNPFTSSLVLMASPEGGVQIEEVARQLPDRILRIELPDSPDELPARIARQVGAFLGETLGATGGLVRALSKVAADVFAAYQRHDASLVEINPLFVTGRGPVAGDAKVILDDNALYRQRELTDALGIHSRRHEVAEATTREKRAQAAGFPYIDLLPEDARREPGKIYVGLVPGGAGYGIFSIDEVNTVGERWFGGQAVPVNFMDSGGGPSQAAVAEMFALLMDHPLVDLIVTSRFGGISSCDVFIRGLVECLRQRARDGQRVVPVYGRMVGTDLAAGRAFLESAQRQTPEALAPLSVVVGNRQIMASVIRDALDWYGKGAGR